MYSLLLLYDAHLVQTGHNAGCQTVVYDGPHYGSSMNGKSCGLILAIHSHNRVSTNECVGYCRFFFLVGYGSQMRGWNLGFPGGKFSATWDIPLSWSLPSYRSGEFGYHTQPDPVNPTQPNAIAGGNLQFGQGWGWASFGFGSILDWTMYKYWRL